MRLAILTDIHSNLPALEEVLEAIDEAGVDETWCLGDVVGYGAQPDKCAELVAKQCDLSLVGNHDLAVLGEIDIDVFSAAAAAAVTWTRGNCKPKTIEFLRGLKPVETDREVALYHASPRDPVWEYVLAVDQAAECMELQSERVSLIGHSHVALFFSDGGAEGGDGGPTGGQAEGGRALDVSDGRWLLNPGSVGQPRDGDPRAAWLELDTEEWKATYHRVAYEIDRAAEAIRGAGLPDLLADRLRRAMSMQSPPRDMTRLASMRRFLAFASVVMLGALCAVGVSACGGGSGGGISSANGSELLSKLDEIDQLTEDGECSAAAETASATASAIAPLSSSQLDPELKTALIDGFQRLAELASDPAECGEEETTTTEEETTQEEEPTAPTTTEEAPPEQTTPTQGTTTQGGGGSGGVGPGGGVSP